jgi:hypothetical protein
MNASQKQRPTYTVMGSTGWLVVSAAGLVLARWWSDRDGNEHLLKDPPERCAHWQLLDADAKREFAYPYITRVDMDEYLRWAHSVGHDPRKLGNEIPLTDVGFWFDKGDGLDGYDEPMHDQRKAG